MANTNTIEGQDYTALTYSATAYSVATNAAKLAVNVNGNFSAQEKYIIKIENKGDSPLYPISASWNKKTGGCGTPPYSRQTVLALFPVFSSQEAGNTCNPAGTRTKPHIEKINIDERRVA